MNTLTLTPSNQHSLTHSPHQRSLTCTHTYSFTHTYTHSHSRTHSLTPTLTHTGSWDGTLKLWDVYKNTCIETMEHGCDVLAVAFRPDGKEICAAATSGNLHIWDVEVKNV